MTALILFLASFCVVFAMGFQQMNVTARLYAMAFGTSLVIGASQLVQFKLLPQPTGWLDLAGYLLGNATGIVCAMKAHPALMQWRARAQSLRAMVESACIESIEPDEPWSHAAAVQLEQRPTHAERTDLEASISLESSVSEIEMFCHPLATSAALFYDVRSITDESRRSSVDRALRYLQLRNAIAYHPQHAHLVRITP